jgi:hypothetical protein
MNNKRIALSIIGALVIFGFLDGQESVNTSGRMLKEEDRFTIGGYGQIDFNQPLSEGTMQNGGLDVHRMVLMFGYKFSSKTQFISEFEFEHVKEVYVEQAFLQHELLPWLKFRGGLMLVPMGIINEFHEPPTFNGVERPNIDKYIVPTTWREIGAGFTGVFPSAAISYQIYVMNGFSSYDNGPKLSGSNGFRKGRQKGAESFMSAPNLTFRINYFGISGLQFGISSYSGKTQSTLFDGVEKNDAIALANADSSVVGLNMLGVDFRYTHKGFNARGQLNYGIISNAIQYNEFTGSDIGSAISGWYGEIAYDVLHSAERLESELIPFARYERYNTHASIEEGMELNPAYDRTDITFGLGWKITSGAMIKVDYQIFIDKYAEDSPHQFNAGIGIWF